MVYSGVPQPRTASISALVGETLTSIGPGAPSGVVIVSILADRSPVVFLSGLDAGEVGFERLFLAWVILCTAHAVNAWAGLWHCALNGLGHVGWPATRTVMPYFSGRSWRGSRHPRF